MTPLLRCLALMLCAALAGGARAGDPALATFCLGVVNERSDRPDFALEQYSAMHAWLAPRLGDAGVALGKLVIAQSVEEMGERLTRGEVDAVIESVVPTLVLERSTDRLDPALLAWRKGQREYRSVFFVRSDDPARSLADLRGRSIAFESARSTSAYYVPRAELEAAGLTVVPAEQADAPESAVRFRLVGSEINQAYWVERGLADAGAFNDGDWERTPAALRARLRIIHTTLPLPRWLLSFRRGLDPRVRAAATRALTQMHTTEQGRAALQKAERISRFEPLTPQDLAALDHWRKRLQAMEIAR